MAQISKRAVRMPASPLRKLISVADKRKKKGIKVYHLNIGQPDIKTPAVYYRELKKYNQNPTPYAPSQGLASAILAWQKYYSSVGIKIKPEEIIITSGGSEALVYAMCAVADPGEEILAFEPFYTNYNGFGAIGGINVKAVTLKIENGFHLPSDKEIEKKITKKTKALIFTNPSNPTGTVFTKAELGRIVNIVKKHNLFLITDETYREFSFTGKKCFSLMNFPQIKDKVILVDSASKRFNVCGARVGTLVSHNQEIIQSVFKFCMARLSVSTVEQLAIIPLLLNSQKYIKPVIAEYKKRRDVLYNGLKEIPGLTMAKPEGAFYIICGLPVKSSEDFARWMIDKFSYHGETVLVSPAPGFYATKGLGLNEIRIAYVLNRQDLKKALSLLKIALEQYKD